MITAIYTHGKKEANKHNFILFVTMSMFVAYAVGCITIKIFPTTDFLSHAFEMLIDISQGYGYIGCFFALFLPKFIIFLFIYFSAYFCFGKITDCIISILFSVLIGQLGGYLYSSYSFYGILIFVSSFLLFEIVSCFLFVLRINDSAKVSAYLFRSVFLKDNTNFDFNNKSIAVKSVITLLAVLIITLLQALIFKIVIYTLV